MRHGVMAARLKGEGTEPWHSPSLFRDVLAGESYAPAGCALRPGGRLRCIARVDRIEGVLDLWSRNARGRISFGSYAVRCVTVLGCKGCGRCIDGVCGIVGRLVELGNGQFAIALR